MCYNLKLIHYLNYMNSNNYGYIFNNIQFTENHVIKTAKNEKGLFKINNEILFYNKINKEHISFPIPKLILSNDGILKIKYIKNASVLTYHVNNTNIDNYINNISKHLNVLHSNIISVSRELIIKDTIQEVENKIIKRYNEGNWEMNELFNKINTVNNVKIRKDISFYIKIIKHRLVELINKIGINKYNLIHGDTHLGNILLDNSNNIYFIDPRGYFGNTKLYGLKQYDFAKLLFGLSGYSVFDNMNIEKLNINNDNLNIEFIKNYEYVFQNNSFDEITQLFSLSIWLGNNSCFLNVKKKFLSLMISFYYCEKYLINSKKSENK